MFGGWLGHWGVVSHAAFHKHHPQCRFQMTKVLGICCTAWIVLIGFALSITSWHDHKMWRSILTTVNINNYIHYIVSMYSMPWTTMHSNVKYHAAVGDEWNHIWSVLRQGFEARHVTVCYAASFLWWSICSCQCLEVNFTPWQSSPKTFLVCLVMPFYNKAYSPAVRHLALTTLAGQ